MRSKYRPAGGAWVNEQSFPVNSSCERLEPDRGLDVDASGRFVLLWFAANNDTLGAIRGAGQAGVWTSTVLVPGDQTVGQHRSRPTTPATS